MARERSPERPKAFDIYKQSGGKITNREIANIMGISEKTVGGWKCKDGWDDELNGVRQKKRSSTPEVLRSTPKETEYSNKIGVVRSESIAAEDEDDFDSGELTARQRIFVAEYLVDMNATQAAIRAGYSENTAGSIGSENLKKPQIQDAIQRAIRDRERRTTITQDMVVEQLAKIAFADIKQVVTWDNRGITLRPSDEVDGTILSEVSENVSDTGVTTKVKLNDRMKALLKLYEHFGEESRLKLELLRADVVKATGNGGKDSGVRLEVEYG